MKFTIITCTYNRSNLLEKNIKSVLKQKFKSFEHFIVDDGSKDNTPQIIKKYPHIKYIKLNKNYGQPGAMYYSRVLKKIKGNYVILLDSDDFLLSNAKKIIVNSIKKYNNKNFWSYSFCIKSSHKEKINIDKKIFKSKEIYSDEHPRFNLGKGYRDFLDVRKRIFFKKFQKYFKSPGLWYSSFPEVNIRHKFNEIFIDKKIIFMSFDNNNVTKGHNFKKYAPITLRSRQHIFNKFKNYMGVKYYNYNLKSLFINQLIFPGYKWKNFKLLNREKRNLLNKIDYIYLMILLLFPSQLFFRLKNIIKTQRKKR